MKSIYVVLVFALVSTQALAQTSLLHAGNVLINADDDVLSEQTIVVTDGSVQGVYSGYRSAQELNLNDATVVDLKDQFVMPGLVDLHVHLIFERDPNADEAQGFKDNDADATLKSLKYLDRTLRAGFTTVRDLGSDNDIIFALKKGVQRGDILGPRIIAAGEAITPTGGHGDMHSYLPEIQDAFGPRIGVCNGADDCMRATRAMIKRGADVIKITATGGVLSNTKAGLNQQLTDSELEAIVSTAHNLGRPVTAHAHGAGGIKAALRAGVDSIEHGSYLDADVLKLFKKTDAYLVPTLLAGVSVKEEAEINPKIPAPIVEKINLIAPVVRGSFERALDKGINIAFGTDSGVSKHGHNAREFNLLVEYGMSEREAIASSIKHAPKLLMMEDKIGKIEAGYYADIIAVDSSPLTNIDALHSVNFVMKQGQIIQ